MKRIIAAVKGRSGRLMAWTGSICVAAVMMFSMLMLTAPAARAAEVSSAEIAECRAAAAKGDALAQYNLGIMYDTGQGVPEDYATAAMWYTKAAEQGDARAQYNLGIMYNTGQGVPENDATAAKWYTKAAEQEDANAQYNLGIMYSNGDGVPEDNVLAYMWVNLASAQGNSTAKKDKGILKERMTPADISSGQTLSRECLANNYKNCG
jgi:TPR repeat protein